MERIIGRGPLVEELATELDEGGVVQVIVGPTGSGKTMVLLKLAQRLASHGEVPVPVSLRDGTEVNFEERARKAYRQASPGCTDEEAEKQWRWLRRGKVITVIVDDLEKTEASPDAVARALDAAASQHLRIVAACRPTAIPAHFKRGRVDLEPLDSGAVEDDLTERLVAALERSKTDSSSPGKVDRLIEHARSTVERLVDHAQIASTPYYLAIARVLADTCDLAELSPPRSQARVALLNAYRHVLYAGTVPLGGGLSKQRRALVLDRLEAIAFVRLQGHKTVEEVTEAILPFWPCSPEMGPGTVIEYGQRLGILETRFDGRVRFGHPTTLAHLASRFLVEHKDDLRLWNQLLDADVKRITATGSLALVLAAAAVNDTAVVENACRRLLSRPELDTGNGHIESGATALYERLLVLKTVTEIASNPGGTSKLVVEKIIEIINAEGGTGALSLEQTRLVREAALLDSTDHDVLWTFITKARDYRVRRAATRELIDHDQAAVTSALKRIDAILDEADSYRRRTACPVDTDRREPFDSLRAVAWILPCLRSICTDRANSARLRDYQERLLELAKTLTKQRGLEASIAQGLKLDAVRDPALMPDPVALEMLEHSEDRAQFWFSRVMLLQAVTTRCLQDERAEAARRVVFDAQDDEHPFVRETARLCTSALKIGSGQKYLWEDMTEIAAGMRSELANDAKHLIGEIVLALNLNDGAPDDMRIRFGTGARLPSCLEYSPHRHEILGSAEPRKDCPFRTDAGCLCPYTYDPPPEGIRRELSRAFCRHRRSESVRLPWHHNLGPRELKEFWRELESLARF